MINNSNCKYIKQEYFPVNMMPDNPEMLYYTIKYNNTDNEPNCGEPLYSNNILYGICGRNNKDKLFNYVTPIKFILKSIDNEKNNLYKCSNIKSIKSIDKYNVYEDMIYSPQFRYYIKLESYLLYLSNSPRQINYNNIINLHIKFENMKNIKKNTFLLHWCKLFSNENLIKIIKNIYSRQKTISINVNKSKFIYTY